MRRATSTEDRDQAFPADEPTRRAAAITAMGYRLAAAGPRTRQRLLDREPPQLALPQPEAIDAEPLPALVSWDDAAWDRRLSGEPEPGLARLSAREARFPIWRAAALLASAACGFSLVLFGQNLHLDHKHRTAAHDPKSLLLAEAAPPTPQPAAQTPSSLTPPEIVAPVSTAKSAEAGAPQQAAPPIMPTPADQHPWITAGSTITQPSGPSPAPVQRLDAQSSGPQQLAPPSAAPSGTEPLPHATEPPTQIRLAARSLLPARAVSQSQPAGLRYMIGTLVVTSPKPAEPRFAEARFAQSRFQQPRLQEPKQHAAIREAAAQHELPRWLTEDRPEHTRELIMSPPPHDLEPPPGAATVASARPPATQPPIRAAQYALPPIPQPGRRPDMIYAEAHYVPQPPPGTWPGRGGSYGAPYYPHYPPASGYYGVPPATPYDQP